MTATPHGSGELTRNQALVLGALAEAGAPLGAYAILDRLRGDGLRAPLQIYRALEKLVEAGRVHRLESLNAFVACRHGEHGRRETMAFAICDQCGSVAELADERLDAELEQLAGHSRFKPRAAIVELRGRCRNCA